MTLKAGNDLCVVIFPGKSNSFTLYEDAGDGSEFTKGEFTQTKMLLEWGETPMFHVKPVQGAVELLPEIRNYEFILRGYHRNIQVKTFIDGKEVVVQTKYEEATASMKIKVSAKITSEIQLLITGDVLITDNGDKKNRFVNLLQKMQLATEIKERILPILLDSNMPIVRKISQVNYKCLHSPQHQELVETLIEQLTLVEE